MSARNLTTNQKIDALYEMVTGLTQAQSSMQKDISEMKSDIKIIKKEVHSLVTVVPDALMMAAKSRDRLDDIDEKKESFTPFTSGAFAA